MPDPAAIQRFADRQKQLLAATYVAAWQTGVDNYEPDDDPPADEQLPEDLTHPEVVAAVGVGGLAYLAARRLRRYRAPTAPDPARQERATRHAAAGVDRMALELANLAPTAEHLATANGDPVKADQAALQDWIDGNGSRLNGGESVAWAGEQDGYTAAASADGMLLSWNSSVDENVCDDCGALSDLPPMPEPDWPTSPGTGDTECNVGCRCSMEAVDWTAPLFTGEPAAPDVLTPAQTDLVDRIAMRAGPQVPVLR